MGVKPRLVRRYVFGALLYEVKSEKFEVRSMLATHDPGKSEVSFVVGD